MRPRVTVIICTRDRPIQLEACLEALSEQRCRAFDVLVVDNGTTDAVAEICRARGVACIRESVPGLTRARNLGARAAHADLLAFIDDDAIAEPGWLQALIREFEDPRVAAVAGRTRYMRAAAGALTMTAVEATGEVPERPHRRFDRAVRDWFALACFGGIGDGNTMMFRRSALLASVRFDERIGRGRLIDGGDEHVAFMSLISDGFTVVHAPDAIVRHPVPESPALRREKRERDLRGSIAYLLFLWAQFPAHRGDIYRYLLRRIVARGPRLASSATRGLSRGQVIRAALDAIRLYPAATREWAGPPAGKAPVARTVTRR